MPGKVMVFAPAPQLTITIEHVGDGAEIHLHAGGQGIWQARMIRSLGVGVVLVCALGGEIGAVLRPLLEAENVELSTVRTLASNGSYVHDRRDGVRAELARAPGKQLSRHEQDELYGVALANGLRAEISVLGGVVGPEVLPPDMYRRLAGDLRRNGSRVLADLSGDYLRAALAGGLDLVKVSHEELLRDKLIQDDDPASVVKAMHQLRADGAQTVIVSRAEKPALVLLDDAVLQVHSLELEAADHHGAGDSMTAGVAAVLAQGGEVTAAIRTGAAAGALNVTRRGLGTGRADVIAQLVERIRLTPLGGAAQAGPGADLDDVLRPVVGEEHTSPDELAARSRCR